MIKKKRKKGTKAVLKEVKKAAKKKGGAKRKRGKKEQDARDVRQQCNKLVKEKAKEMTAAVIGEGKKGQVAPVRFLFEMANIFPQADDGNQTSAREESLAETLLNRLGIPTSPVVADEYEREANEVIPVTLALSEEVKEKETDKVEEKSAAEESAELTIAGE